MSKVTYKVLGEMGVFMPFIESNLQAAIQYPANRAVAKFNDHFETEHLKNTSSSSTRKVGRIGSKLSGIPIALNTGLYRETKDKLNAKTPTKKGTYLFVAVYAIYIQSGQAVDLKTVDLVPTASPLNTARVLSSCDKGEISCARIAPLNPEQFNISAYILAKVY